MIRFIDLTTQYFCNNDGPMQAAAAAWAFIDTTVDRFLEAGDGSHLFDLFDIDEHPQAERLRRLIPTNPANMETLVWVVNSYSGDTLALEKSYIERFFIIEREAQARCVQLNQRDGEGIWKVMPVLIRKGDQ